MKPNVLQMIDSFEQGGTERQVVQLTRLLQESSSYRLHLICLSGRGPLRAEVERMGFRDIPEFPLNSFHDLNAARQLGRLSRFMRAREIDLVHAHDFYTNIFGMTAALMARVPARIASRRETDGIRSRAQRIVERRAYNMAHAIVVNAGAVGQQLIQEGVPARKIVTVYNGLDLQRLTPPEGFRREEFLSELGLPVTEGLRFVTIVANMRHVMKDQATFLRAAKRVRASVPEARFILAGEGEQMESLKALAAELGLADYVFFIGRSARVAELLAVSDVCVLSSRGVEGFSNSIIEYMAAARPVVATDVGGAREAILEGETGFVVAPQDDLMMAERITRLLCDRELAQRLGERGRERVATEFSLQAQLERTERLYERLLNKLPVQVAQDLKSVGLERN